MAQFEFGPEPPETVDVHVDRPGAEVITARERHTYLAAAGEEGAEHEDGRPHLPNKIERGLGSDVLRDIDGERVILQDAGRPDVLEDVAHELDVDDVRDVLEQMFAGSQQRSHLLFEDGVLGPQDDD